MEDTPGMAELLPGSGMDMEFRYCISGAAGTPAPVWDDNPDAFPTFIRSQDAVWRELVELSGAGQLDRGCAAGPHCSPPAKPHTFRRSARALPLKFSAKALSVGLPGREKSSAILQA